MKDASSGSDQTSDAARGHCGSCFAHTATTGLFAGPRARHEADRSFGNVAAFLPAPHQAVMTISPWSHCALQAVASHVERITRTELAVDAVGPCGPWGPSGPTSPLGPGGPASPLGPAGPTSPLAPGGPGAPGSPFGPWSHAPRPAATVSTNARSRNLIRQLRI
jgi:hypothetical protein